jgi:hypothetical protein
MSYKIEQWHSYLYPNEVFPVPVVFVKDDDDLKMSFNTKIKLSIEDTNDSYDNVTEGIILKDLIKGYRAITLASNWFGYPDENGKVKIRTVMSNLSDEDNVNKLNNKLNDNVNELNNKINVTINDKTYDIKLFIQIILVIMIIYLFIKVVM